MLEKMYVEDYGLTRYELGDAAVIKKYLQMCEDRVSEIDWNLESAELIRELKERSLKFMENEMVWENDNEMKVMQKWLIKRKATISKMVYSDELVKFIEDIRTLMLATK